MDVSVLDFLGGQWILCELYHFHPRPLIGEFPSGNWRSGLIAISSPNTQISYPFILHRLMQLNIWYLK